MIKIDSAAAIVLCAGLMSPVVAIFDLAAGLATAAIAVLSLICLAGLPKDRIR